jgi:hypothetical protein
MDTDSGLTGPNSASGPDGAALLRSRTNSSHAKPERDISLVKPSDTGQTDSIELAGETTPIDHDEKPLSSSTPIQVNPPPNVALPLYSSPLFATVASPRSFSDSRSGAPVPPPLELPINQRSDSSCGDEGDDRSPTETIGSYHSGPPDSILSRSSTIATVLSDTTTEELEANHSRRARQIKELASGYPAVPLLNRQTFPPDLSRRLSRTNFDPRSRRGSYPTRQPRLSHQPAPLPGMATPDANEQASQRLRESQSAWDEMLPESNQVDSSTAIPNLDCEVTANMSTEGISKTETR